VERKERVAEISSRKTERAQKTYRSDKRERKEECNTKRRRGKELEESKQHEWKQVPDIPAAAEAVRHGSRSVNVCGAVNTQYTGRVASRGLLSLSDGTPSWLLDIGRRPSQAASGQHELTKTYGSDVIGSPVRSLQTSLRKE
jgi:hypothetical protein